MVTKATMAMETRKMVRKRKRMKMRTRTRMRTKVKMRMRMRRTRTRRMRSIHTKMGTKRTKTLAKMR